MWYVQQEEVAESQRERERAVFQPFERKNMKDRDIFWIFHDFYFALKGWTESEDS